MSSTGRIQLPLENGKSIGDLVTDTLRRAIIMRQLKLGERLVESKVAAELNVSITPLRHAFQRLANEGLIEVLPYKGSYVVTVTPEFIADVCYCRRMVELASAEQAYDNLTQTDPQCLIRIIGETMETYEKTSDVYDVITGDMCLHRTIISNAKHKTLYTFWMQLTARMMLLQSYAKQEGFNSQQFYSRHIGLAEAIAQKQGKEVFVDRLDKNLRLAYSPDEVVIMLREAERESQIKR